MTPNEFVIWLKGFIQASSNFTLTPKQFDDMKEQLDRVELYEKLSRYTLDNNSTNWSTSIISEDRNDVTYKTAVPTTKTI